MHAMDQDVSDQFVCGHCKETLDSLTAFLLHKVQHVDTGKSSGCPLCDLSFSRQTSFREHLHRKHSIPGLKCTSVTGKQKGRPKKESFDHENITENPSKSVGDEKMVVTGDNPDSHKYINQETMHIIIDKIGGDLSTSDLSHAVMQVNCSVVPPDSSSVIVEDGGDGDFNQLLEQVNSRILSHSQDFPHPPETLLNHDKNHESEILSINSQSVGLHNSSPDLQNHLHVLQSPQDSLETVAVNEKVPLVSEASISLSAEPAFSFDKSSHSLQNQIQCVPEGSQDPLFGSEPEFDFVFILLTNHVKRKSMNYSKQSFKCFHCQYKTFWLRALVKHMRENHADDLATHQCIAVSNSEKVKGQQVMKMSEYKAVLARQRKLTNTQRNRGVERQDLPGYHPCNECDKVFGRLRYLRKHQVIHKLEKRFLCDDCGKAFKTKAYLVAHRQTHQIKVYKCSQCDFTSSITALIHAHRQLHNDSCIICDVCGSAYNDRSTLRKHQKVHDKSRPFPCDYPGCTWRFKTEVMCRAHYRRHTTTGRFICHLCSYVFRQKHHLQRHLSKIHGLDEAAIFHALCIKNVDSSKNVVVEDCEDKEFVQVVQRDDLPLTDTVNLIVNSGLSSEQLQSVLQSGQFVIATDDSDSAVNYEVANITMNVNYDTLTETAVSEGQTIFIPNDGEIVFQHESDTVSSSMET